MKRALQDEVNDYYKKFSHAGPEFPKARIIFDEEYFVLKVPLYTKRT